MTSFNTVHIADIHFGKKDDLKLYDELKLFISSLNEYIETEKVHLLCIEGDLYDRVIKMNELTSKLVIDFINELCELTDKHQIYFRILKGTKGHDFNQLSVFKGLESKYPYFKIISNVEKELLDVKYDDGSEIEYNVLYLPEEYPSNVYSYYSDYFNDEYDQIMGHGMIDFVAFTGNDDENSERFVRNAPVFKSKDLINICNGPIVFGHIHDFHEYKEKIYYCGSYSRYSFADQEDKGFLFTKFYPENNTFDIEFIENPEAPTYYVVNLDEISESWSSDEKIKYLNYLKKEYDFIKIKTSNTEGNVDLIKTLVSKDESFKMEVKNLDVEEEKVDEQFLFILNREYDLPTTIQKYIQLTSDREIPLDTIKEIIS